MELSPKEKASELVEKYLSFGFRLFDNYIPVPLEAAKQCAIIAVDEIIKELWYVENNFDVASAFRVEDYWNEVKTELENI
jgi:hypothetical protein